MKKTLKSNFDENLVEMVLRGYASMVADIIVTDYIYEYRELYHDEYEEIRSKIFHRVMVDGIIGDVEKLIENMLSEEEGYEACLKDVKYLRECIPDWV
jgi:hypothetical protein